MMLPAPEAILFDWDNTLVNTWPTIHEALNHTLVQMGHAEWPLERVKGNVKKSMRDSFPELFGDRWEEAAEAYQGYYRSVNLMNLQSLPDAEAVLKALQEKPIRVGVVSNKKGVNLREEIQHIGWDKYFEVIVGAQDAARDKPHPDPIELALSRLDMHKGEHVWFIGDTIVDLEAAQNADCTPLLYGEHETDEGEYLGYAFARHVRDHQGLMQLLAHY